MDVVASRVMEVGTSDIGALASGAPAPVLLPRIGSAVETVDGEPLLHALSACMLGAIVFALITDVLATKARRADARIRKKVLLQQLKSKVAAQRARERDMHAAASAAHMSHTEALARQSTLCADEPGQPVILPVVFETSSHRLDQVATPPSSPVRLDAAMSGVNGELRVSGLELTTSASKEDGPLANDCEATRRRDGPQPSTCDGGDLVFSSRKSRQESGPTCGATHRHPSGMYSELRVPGVITSSTRSPPPLDTLRTNEATRRSAAITNRWR